MKTTTHTLFTLEVSTWRASDYFDGANCDPVNTDLLLFGSRDQAEEYAMNLDADSDYVYVCDLYHGDLSEEEILDESGFETMQEFAEALEEKYSTTFNRLNYGEREKTALAEYIANNFYSSMEESIPCANYNHKASIEGAIIVEWKWHRYIGYAREIIDIRFAGSDDDASMLAERDNTRDSNYSIIMDTEESEDLRADLERILSKRHWKWTNESKVARLVEEIAKMVTKKK